MTPLSQRLQEEESDPPWLVVRICTAYESGYGHAGDDLPNPYKEDTDEWHAYAWGKHIAARRAAAMKAREDG